MRKIVILLVLIQAFMNLSKAQYTTDRCSYDQLLETHLDRFPEMENRIQEIEDYYQTTTSTSNVLQRDGLITIPVVVHIVYNNERENISDLQVYSQIEVLNEDFRLLNENVRFIPSEFEDFAEDIEIEFCLASLDTSNVPTTGINRVKTDIACIGDFFTVKDNGRSRLFYSSLGGADVWDPEHYLNIWVANSCDSTILGATPSIALQDFLPEEDGIVIDYNFFGNNCNSSNAAPYHLGRTATHEIGHYLGLLHPWGDCGDMDSDFVTDTPRQEDPYYGCPNYPQRSCNSSDMYMNFMNYSDDACMSLFTRGQKERMLETLAGPRIGLTQSVGCAFLSPPVPFGPEAILLYPNPAKNCIHIDFNAEIPGDIDIEMVNALGQIVYRNLESSRNFRSIDAANLTDGIYYVTFRAAKQTITKKVMVLK